MAALIHAYKSVARRDSKHSKQRLVAVDSRRALLACGRELIERGGVRGLTVRGVATRARVNLGTFVYHFGTRERFIAEVLESWYAPIYARLQLTVDEQLPPVQKLRHFVLRFFTIMVENRRFTRAVVLDLAGGETAVKPFALSLFGRHPQLLLRLVREAQEAGELQPGDPLELAIFLAGGTLIPSLWAGILLPDGLVTRKARAAIDRLLLTPAQIERRFEWAIRSLRPQQAAADLRPKTKISGTRRSRSGSRS